MKLSTPKKILFSVIAIALPLMFIELVSYTIIKVFFPKVSAVNKTTASKNKTIFRTDYRSNDFSDENYDYQKDFYGPYLHDSSLILSERLIGPQAVKHYLRLDHYTLFPFTMFHTQRHYRSAIVNTNHLGFRARELSDYENDPRPKILILGGSAIFGSFLTSDDKTISAQLEAYLRSHGKEVTCVNLAMQGHTSEQEMITLSRIGMRLNPSLVIALDGCNDVVHYSNNRDLPRQFPKLADLFYHGIPADSPPGVYLRGLLTHWGKHSSFFCLAGVLASKPWSTSKEKISEKIDDCSLFPERSDEQAIIDNYLNSHLMMSSLCRGRNLGYIAGLQPMCGIWIEPRWQGEEKESIVSNQNFVRVFSMLDENLNALAQREGFLYINFGKVLAREDNIYNFTDAVHLTDMSSGLMAKRLGEIILSQFPGIFNPSPQPKSQTSKN